MPDVRFASIGTSQITSLFLEALAQVEGASYVGAYSRDLKRAEAFGAPRGATLFFDSLDALSASAEVDAIYIASPNALHAQQALACVRAGKHVLVEKAFASNEREAREVFDLAREQGVVAMEATRCLHVPAMAKIEEVVAGLGPIFSARLPFAKVTSRIAKLEAGERVGIFDPHLAGGALTDIGVYCVEPAIALFGVPEKVCALGVTTKVPFSDADDPFDTIDLSGEALLGYDDKVVCLSFGKVIDDETPCQIAGARGTLLWDHPSDPCNLRLFEHEDKGMVFRMGGHVGRVIEVEVPEADMAFEVADFVGAVSGCASARAIRDRCEEVTLGSLHVMDEIRTQLGVVFPADVA